MLFCVYLFLSRSASALGELAVVVHGGRPASRGLPALAALRIKHPPGTLPRALVLHADEAAVQRQVVPDGVLGEE